MLMVFTCVFVNRSHKLDRKCKAIFLGVKIKKKAISFEINITFFRFSSSKKYYCCDAMNSHTSSQNIHASSLKSVRLDMKTDIVTKKNVFCTQK